MRRFAEVHKIMEIAPAITRQSAKLMEIIINNYDVETQRQRQDGMLYFLGMRDALESEGIITPQQSKELREYAESFMKGGEN